MRELLMSFKREVLVEYLVQRCWHDRRNIERELLYFQWDLEAKYAQNLMDEACEQMQKAENREQYMAAQKAFNKALKLSMKSDAVYKKMEGLRR